MPKSILKNTIEKLITNRGAMILEGYNEDESCIKYTTELINDLKNQLY